LLFANINDQLTIVDKRFKNGRITGKITATKFIGDAHRRIMQISIGCGIENSANIFSTSVENKNSIEKINRYFNELSIEEEKSSRIRPDDIVTSVEIKNCPEEQEEILSKENAKTIPELESHLKKHRTKIKIHLRPLTTTRVISKNINLPNFYV
jgi:hypothetical protein